MSPPFHPIPRFFTGILLAFCTIPLPAQFLDGSGSDRITDLVITGNQIAICGYQTENAQLNGTALPGFGNDDATLTLTGLDGEILHHLVLGGALDDQSEGVTADAAGNIYWTGTYRGTATLGDLTLSDPMNQKAVFVAKISPTAEILWVQTITGQGFKILEELAWHPNGDVVAVGSFSETITFDDGTERTAAAARDALLVRFDEATGDILVTTQFGTSGTFSTRSVTATPDGTFHLAGDFNGTASVLGQSIQTNTDDEDIFYAQFTPLEGITLLERIGGALPALLSEIVADEEGNVYLGGAFFGTLSTDDGFTTGSASFNNDGWLMRRNADGTTGWLRSFGTAAPETIRALAFDDGRLFAGGIFSENFTENSINFTPSGGSTTGYVARFDPATGELEEREIFGSAELTFVFALDAKDGAPPVVGGQFTETLNFEGQPIGPAQGFAAFWGQFGNTLVPTIESSTTDFRVFPNPVAEVLSFSEVTEFELWNATGTLMAIGTAAQIETSELTPGLYLLRTKFGTQWIVRR